MIKERVGLSRGGYDILIGEGLLEQAAGLLEPLAFEPGPVAVVTDKNVWGFYGEAFVSALRLAGVGAHPVVLPPGEQIKSMKGLSRLYDAFAEMKLRRGNPVIALGGGVIGDLCGFAAATYMRGLPYIQVPTTLLAQVDSSVGGKTGINLEYGKNMAGAFYQPRLVVIDPATLKTLPEREFRCGMAEVIKYGAIRSRQVFDGLLSLSRDDDLTETIRACCRIKAEIVGRDELDQGERMLLNFGHSFGHAIERAFNYEKYNHGEAIAIGMVIASALGEEMGLTQTGASEELSDMLMLHGLGLRCPCPWAELAPILETDKKSRAEEVRMVFLNRIGEAFVHPVGFEELEAAVRKAEEKWKTPG